MMKVLMREVVDPLGRRAGTALAAYLVAKGAQEDVVHLAINGGLAAAAIAADLFNSHRERKARKED